MAQLNESHGRVKAPPKTADLNTLRNYVEELANHLAKLAKDLDYIINGNLDVKNIRANSITAEALNVDQLSAISANLGEITAGIIRGIEIYGSFIATSESGYPRVEMSTTDKYFKVWLNVNTYIEIIDQGDEGMPQIIWNRGSQRFRMGHGIHYTPSGTFPGLYSNTQFTISAEDKLELFSTEIDIVNWGALYNITQGKTLQQEINDLTSAINSLTTAINNKATKGAATSSSGLHDHGIPDGTELLTTTGTVTFYASGSHSHAQN